MGLRCARRCAFRGAAAVDPFPCCGSTCPDYFCRMDMYTLFITSTDNVYFMVCKSEYIDKPHKSSDEYVSGDFVETYYYTVLADFTDVDDDTRDDITKFDDMQLSENDLLDVVREIIDEHQVTDIYMDSL